MAVRAPLSKHLSLNLKQSADEDMEEGLAHNTKDEPSPVNDLNCPLCFDILLDPVTLVCGHTYCEICLAQLWKNEERNWTNEPPSILCPSCRNPTDKFPQVNFMLRYALTCVYSRHFTIGCPMIQVATASAICYATDATVRVLYTVSHLPLPVTKALALSTVSLV